MFEGWVPHDNFTHRRPRPPEPQKSQSMPSFLKYLILVPLALPSEAQAYLDPASGNALGALVAALFTSAAFFFRSAFYRISALISGSEPANAPTPQSSSEPPILLFSEGLTYWSTFQPIVEELLARGVTFSYLTLDHHDPGLLIDTPQMHAKLVPRNRAGFAKIQQTQARVMLSTTPNIGCPDYPLQRPPRVKDLVHVFHAMANVSCYRKGSLDFYDSVLMMGPHEEAPIRLVEHARGLKTKRLLPAGLPYLEVLHDQRHNPSATSTEQASDGQFDTARTTVLIAPSWGPKSCLSEYGTDFIKGLAVAGYNILIRLHPHSHSFEPEQVQQWKDALQGIDAIQWDTHALGTHAMAQAQILISDTSSIRFDFAFVYEKPVITLPVSAASQTDFEGDYMDQVWTETMAPSLGTVVKPEDLGALPQIVTDTLAKFTPEHLQGLRESAVSNFGSSSKVIVAYLVDQAKHLNLSEADQIAKIHQLSARLEALEAAVLNPPKPTT